MKKIKPKLDSYQIIKEKVEEWVSYGIRRYYKHRDEEEPKEIESMADEIVTSIMLGLSEVIDWED